jgi:GTP-binding protein
MNETISFFRSVTALTEAPRNGLPEICVSGRSNVGKSSLINCLAGAKRVARISQVHGKTQTLNFYTVDHTCYLVDLPGYGYARASLETRARFGKLVDEYLLTRREIAGLIQVIDARHGPIAGDLDMVEWLAGWDRRVLYVFTKADKLSASARSRILQQYNKELGVENMTLFSASTGMGRDSVWKWIREVVV